MAITELLRMDFFSGLGCCQVKAGEERGAGALKNGGSHHNPRENLSRSAFASAVACLRTCGRLRQYACAWITRMTTLCRERGCCEE